MSIAKRCYDLRRDRRPYPECYDPKPRQEIEPCPASNATTPDLFATSAESPKPPASASPKTRKGDSRPTSLPAQPARATTSSAGRWLNEIGVDASTFAEPGFVIAPARVEGFVKIGPRAYTRATWTPDEPERPAPAAKAGQLTLF